MCFRHSPKITKSPSIKAHLLRSALILLSLLTFNQDIFGQTPTPTGTARRVPLHRSPEADTGILCIV